MANESETPSSSDLTATPAVAPKKNGFQVSQEPLVSDEIDTPENFDAHKYETPTSEAAPVTAPEPTPDYEDLGALPASYGEDTLFLVARDPRWLFCYWDFDWSRFPSSGMRYGYSQFFLKVFRAHAEQEALVEINPSARNWYVPVHHPDTDYIAEIGFFDQAGAWRAVAVSPIAHTPPDALAPEPSYVDFATVPAHLTFERLLDLVQEKMTEGDTLLTALSRVAGEGRIQFAPGRVPTWNDDQKRLLAALLGDTLVDRLGMGSDEIDQLLRKQLGERLHSETASGLAGGLGAAGLGPSTQSLFSAIGASWSAQPFSIRTERSFYMHVNAEIIFYGGTHPDATVTVNGQQIALKPDGSFRYHFTLPDGDFQIPIVATSPDKVEQRSATLTFLRGTQRVGEVGSTGQPDYLQPLIGQKN